MRRGQILAAFIVVRPAGIRFNWGVELCCPGKILRISVPELEYLKSAK